MTIFYVYNHPQESLFRYIHCTKTRKTLTVWFVWVEKQSKSLFPTEWLAWQNPSKQNNNVYMTLIILLNNVVSHANFDLEIVIFLLHIRFWKQFYIGSNIMVQGGIFLIKQIENSIPWQEIKYCIWSAFSKWIFSKLDFVNIVPDQKNIEREIMLFDILYRYAGLCIFLYSVQFKQEFYVNPWRSQPN